VEASLFEDNPLTHIANAIGKGVTAIFGSRNERLIKELLPIVEEINDLEPKFEKLSDAALAERTEDLRKTLKQTLKDEGATKILEDAFKLRLDARTQDALDMEKRYREIEQRCLDDILPEAFALVREAGKRSIGQRHYDVQLLGGICLHQGKISEMVTGEGKTLVSTCPAFLNSLPGTASTSSRSTTTSRAATATGTRSSSTSSASRSASSRPTWGTPSASAPTRATSRTARTTSTASTTSATT
jgi:hypothetical protein